jgi:hypothetical protein
MLFCAATQLVVRNAVPDENVASNGVGVAGRVRGWLPFAYIDLLGSALPVCLHGAIKVLHPHPQCTSEA